jgi:hypothetical protein
MLGWSKKLYLLKNNNLPWKHNAPNINSTPYAILKIFAIKKYSWRLGCSKIIFYRFFFDAYSDIMRENKKKYHVQSNLKTFKRRPEMVFLELKQLSTKTAETLG